MSPFFEINKTTTGKARAGTITTDHAAREVRRTRDIAARAGGRAIDHAHTGPTRALRAALLAERVRVSGVGVVVVHRAVDRDGLTFVCAGDAGARAPTVRAALAVGTIGRRAALEGAVDGVWVVAGDHRQHRHTKEPAHPRCTGAAAVPAAHGGVYLD